MLYSDAYKKRTGRSFLYNIAPIANVASILQLGILSKNLVIKERIPYKSLANEDVQQKRDLKWILNGRLHDYANLYFNPRNPMLYTLKQNNQGQFCLLEVDYTVLDFPEVVVTDMNAAASFSKFLTPREGLDEIDFSVINTVYWNDFDPVIKDYKKKHICAEVLVPDKVPPQLIKGILVPNSMMKCTLLEFGIDEKIISEDKFLFFE